MNNYSYVIRCSSTPSIDLTDDLLREVLFRLPDYATAIRCKTVCKRWHSLISDPSFVVDAFSKQREIMNTMKPSPWTLLFQKPSGFYSLVTAMVAPPHCQIRILSLQFLPYPAKVVATFKDVVLCFGVDPLTKSILHYVCNPVLKQWMALPPFDRKNGSTLWQGLVCRDGGDFRVVAIGYCLGTISLGIYLSETGQWKNVDVKAEYQPYNEGHQSSPFATGVVCKGMVCLTVGSFFCAFNPFDVTHTFSGTLTLVGLPLPQINDQTILESVGKLFVIDAQLNIQSGFDKSSFQMTCKWHVQKLDLNLENLKVGRLLEWELVSKHDGYVEVEVTRTTLTPTEVEGHKLWTPVFVHPYDEHLIYFLAPEHNGRPFLVLCDTKSKTLEYLTRVPVNYYDATYAYYANKLDVLCWPTPVHQKHRQFEGHSFDTHAL